MGTTPFWLPVVVAVIAAAAMLGVARMTAVREREARRADHESARLAELLDAAVDLRDATVALLDELDPEVANARYDRCHAVFLARRESVQARRVRALARAWEAAIGENGSDSGAERSTWRALMVALGQARQRAF